MERWILLTNDKDFGEKVYRDRHGHRGVVLLRLANEQAGNKIETLRRVLTIYAEQLVDRFVVATETRVRFARSSPADQRDNGPSEC
jgi:predicted nuclease of predicted toxin-antitoxin system